MGQTMTRDATEAFDPRVTPAAPELSALREQVEVMPSGTFTLEKSIRDALETCPELSCGRAVAYMTSYDVAFGLLRRRFPGAVWMAAEEPGAFLFSFRTAADRTAPTYYAEAKSLGGAVISALLQSLEPQS